MSVRFFSTFMVLVTNPLKASDTALIIPTEAPNARTRALEASNDFVNSSALRRIFPRG